MISQRCNIAAAACLAAAVSLHGRALAGDPPPPPPNHGGTNRVEHVVAGRIGRIPGPTNFIGEWVINGRVVHATTNTIVVVGAQFPAEGKFAFAFGHGLSNGHLAARLIDATGNPPPPPPPPPPGQGVGPVNHLPESGLLGRWVIGDRPVNVVTNTVILTNGGPVRVGAMVEFRVHPDGTNIPVAALISTIHPVVRPHVVRGPIEALPGNEGFLGTWVIGGHQVIVGTNTLLFLTNGAPATGALALAEGFPMEGGALRARMVTTSTNLPPPPPDGQRMEIVGRLDSLPDNAALLGEWHVAGFTVQVTTNTMLQTNAGPFAVGHPVRVCGVRGGTNVILARCVSTVNLDGHRPPQVRLAGPIEELPEDGTQGLWVVRSVEFAVTADTRLRGFDNAPTTNDHVEVAADQIEDGTLVAKVVRRLNAPPREPGAGTVIGEIGDLPDNGVQGQWTVGDVAITVDADTKIRGKRAHLAVGARVKVNATAGDDGSWTAGKVRILRRAK